MGNPKTIYIGPTATLALGSENYSGLQNIEFFNSLKNISFVANQYLKGKGNFRNYVHNQMPLFLPPLLYRSAKELIPKLKRNDIQFSEKVGIRAQLYNNITNKIVDDFLCINGSNSTHILNTISPAFTASFALADLIIDSSNL